jgi:membrane-bound lytic murein transglycosylase D
MPRYSMRLLVLICAVTAGCSSPKVPVAVGLAPSDAARGGQPAADGTPLVARDTQPGTAPAVPLVSATNTSKSDIDSLSERRLAADSAADEAVLDELAEARPASGDTADADAEAVDEGVKALTNSVTWDIDVETFSDHDRVQYYLDFFGSKGRERMGIWLNRMTQYEAMIRERLQHERLPADLVYLALIESGFSNTATSRAKAVGMWQFMKGTAKHYGLRIDSWVDERRDPFLATDAAARHLRDLTERFGSVYLAAAAYNAGAGRVSRGLVRLPEDDEADPLASDATFFRLYDTKLLHRETKDYVPKLIAAALIAKEPARYGFTVVPEAPAVYDSIVVPDMTGLDVVARLADTTLAAIRMLNPQYLRLATPPGSRSVVRLPAGRGESARLAYAQLPPRRRVTVVEHTVRPGETLSGIALRYHVRLHDLAQTNPKINPRRLRVGQRLVVPTGDVFSAAAAVKTPKASRASKASKALKAPKAAMASKTSTTSKASKAAKTVQAKKTAQAKKKPAGKAGWHRVRPGETLSEIAGSYGVTVGNLRAWNALASSHRILAGQRIRVAPPVSRAEGRKRAPRGGEA